MRRTSAILGDDRLMPHRPRFEGATDVVGPGLGGAVRVGQVGLDASDSLAVVPQRFFHDRLQVVGHGLASIDVRVRVQLCQRAGVEGI